jgi:hypothetical protein
MGLVLLLTFAMFGDRWIDGLKLVCWCAGGFALNRHTTQRTVSIKTNTDYKRNQLLWLLLNALVVDTC